MNDAGQAPSGGAILWRVWGLLYGPRLPSVRLREIEPGISVEIGKVTEAFADDLFAAKVTAGLEDWNATYIAAQPWELEIRSRFTVCVSVIADIEDVALTKARAWLPRLLGILQTLAGGPCYARLLRVENAETGQSMYETTHVFSPKPTPALLTDSQSHLFVERLGRSVMDASSGSVAVLLSEASLLAFMSLNYEALRIPALLAYFKALEGAVNATLSNSAVNDDKATLISLTDDLQQALQAEQDLTKRVKLIHSTSHALQATRREHLKARVKAAGAALSIEENTVGEAIRFVNFRNRELGHYRATPPKEAASWLEGGRAFYIVHAFFANYLDSKDMWLQLVENKISGP